jgi:hypothetical protein
MVVLATLAVGIEQVLLNTDRWVSAVGPLGSDPDVQSSLADAAAVQAANALDVRVQSLPTPLQRLAAPAESALTTFVRDQALNLVQSPQFARLWVDVNRSAHAALLQVLRGEAPAGAALAVSNGHLQLNLLALMPALVQRVQQLPANLVPAGPPIDFGYVNLAPASALAALQQVVGLLDRTTWVLVLAASLLTLVTLVISPERRLTALRLGVGVAIGMVLIGMGLLTAPGVVVLSMADRPFSGALRATLAAVLVSLAQFMFLGSIAAAVIALAALVGGRSRRRPSGAEAYTC